MVLLTEPLSGAPFMSTEIAELVKEYGGFVLEFDMLCSWLVACMFFSSQNTSVFYRNTLIKFENKNKRFNLIYSNYEYALWIEKQILIVDYTKHLYGMDCFTALEQICILDLEDKKFISSRIAEDINDWIDGIQEQPQTSPNNKA